MKNKIIIALLLCTALTYPSQRSSRIPSSSSTPRTKCALTNMSTPTTVPDYSFQRVTPQFEPPMGRENWFGIAQQPAFQIQRHAIRRVRPTVQFAPPAPLGRRNLADQPLQHEDRRETSMTRIPTQRRASASRNISPLEEYRPTSRVHTPAQHPGLPDSPSYADMVRRARN